MTRLPEEYRDVVAVINGTEYPLKQAWPSMPEPLRQRLLQQFVERGIGAGARIIVPADPPSEVLN